MPTYIHEHRHWPHFSWDPEFTAQRLPELRYRQGYLLGRMEALGFEPRSESLLQTLTEDVLKTSEIEGENLDLQQVRSSVARRLKIDIAAPVRSTPEVDGVVDLMWDATRNSGAPLTADRLWKWHGWLFSSGGYRRLRVGAWRSDQSGPMQVVSGPYGAERVHFEAPIAARVPEEMHSFLSWFEHSEVEPILKAAIAHLWFLTIHPFEDGNGRVARAITDLQLARADGSPLRFYSLSAQILEQRGGYYAILERTQKGELEITPWLSWFFGALDGALATSEASLAAILEKAKFWEVHVHRPFNDRQRRMLNQLLDGFEGKLTSSKWAKIAKCSQDTALRDIQQLIEFGLLEKDAAGGRSTGYLLKPPFARSFVPEPV